MTDFPRQKRPCVNCPFRRDVKSGEFPATRYEELRSTCRNASTTQAPLGAPMFACHKSPAGAEFACAGWLAVEGLNHLGVRVAVAVGRLPAEALRPGADWPPLFGSYEEVEETMGGITDEEAQAELGKIAEDVADSAAILDRLAGMIDGSAASLLRVMDEVERLDVEELRYIVWMAAVARMAQAEPDEPADDAATVANSVRGSDG